MTNSKNIKNFIKFITADNKNNLEWTKYIYVLEDRDVFLICMTDITHMKVISVDKEGLNNLGFDGVGVYMINKEFLTFTKVKNNETKNVPDFNIILNKYSDLDSYATDTILSFSLINTGTTINFLRFYNILKIIEDSKYLNLISIAAKENLKPYIFSGISGFSDTENETFKVIIMPLNINYIKFEKNN